MKDLFLRKVGQTLVPVNELGEEGLASYPDQVLLRVKITQPRLLPHHRFFFAFLDEVFEHWPDTHKFQPTDADYHLRAWLLVKAGFSHRFVSEPFKDSRITQKALVLLKGFVQQLTGGKPVWFKQVGETIEAQWPRSISFTNMDEEEFRRVTSVVFAVIYGETGMDVDEYYERWKIKEGSLQVAPTRGPKVTYPETEGDDIPA